MLLPHLKLFGVFPSHFSESWKACLDLNPAYLWCLFLSPSPRLARFSSHSWRHLLQFFKHVMYPMACVFCSVTQLCATLCDPMDCSPPVSFCPWKSAGKNTGVGGHFFLQRIALTQRSNPCLLHWQADSLPMCHLGRHSKLSPASTVFFLVIEPTLLTPRI